MRAQIFTIRVHLLNLFLVTLLFSRHKRALSSKSSDDSSATLRLTGVPCDDESELLKLDDEQDSPHAVFNFRGFLAFVMMLPQTGSPTLMSYLGFTASAVVGRLLMEMCVTGGAAEIARWSIVIPRVNSFTTDEMIRTVCIGCRRTAPLFSGWYSDLRKSRLTSSLTSS